MDIYWINYITKMLCYMEFGHGMTILRIVIPHPDRCLWQLAWQYNIVIPICDMAWQYNIVIPICDMAWQYNIVIPTLSYRFVEWHDNPKDCRTISLLRDQYSDYHTFPWFVILIVIPSLRLSYLLTCAMTMLLIVIPFDINVIALV